MIDLILKDVYNRGLRPFMPPYTENLKASLSEIPRYYFKELADQTYITLLWSEYNKIILEETAGKVINLINHFTKLQMLNFREHIPF